MKTLTVWKFDSSTGATEALSKLGQVQKQHLIEIADAAIVNGRRARRNPRRDKSTIWPPPELSVALSGECCLE